MKKSLWTFPLRTAKIPYVCQQCRYAAIPSTSRAYSTRPSPLPPPPSGRVLLKSRSLLHLWGPDSAHYLQGAITANVSPSNPRISPFFAAFLDARGRVLADVFIYPLVTESQRSAFDDRGDSYSWLIEVDSEEASRLMKLIRRHRLRAKYDVRVLDEGEADVWSVWRDEGENNGVFWWTAHSFPGSQFKDSVAEDSQNDMIGFTDPRAPGLGKRIIRPGKQSLEKVLGEDYDVAELTEDIYKIRRYLNGVPEGQRELLREKALVQDSNLDYMGAVDYRKGCYVGQELTIRTFHTGVVRKRILPLMLYDSGDPVPEKLEYKYGPAAEIPEGTEIVKVESKRKGPGKWITGIGNLGLGLVRLETMAVPSVLGQGEEFTFSMDDGDSDIKVKAFIPSWHLGNPYAKPVGRS